MDIDLFIGMIGMDQSQRRRYFRLTYPPGDRPILTLKGTRYLAIDISEEGARFSLTDVKISQLSEGMTVSGSLDFNGRGSFQLSGIIIRINEDSAAIKFKKLLPLKHIMAEQRYLIQKYKKV